MRLDRAKEIHDLLFTFMGLFHEKYLHRVRLDNVCEPSLKKNPKKILSILYQHDPITLTDIGKMLDIEKGSMTTLIDALEEKEFVIRSSDPSDRRKTLISLSPQGKDEMDRIMNVYTQKVDELLLKVDPNEIREFQTNMQHVIEFLKKL